MSAQDMSFSELATATAPFASGPFADWWRADPMGRVFAPEFDRLRPIVAGAPAASSEIGRLTELIADEDVVHDGAIRFGVGYLKSFSEHYRDRAIRELAARLLAMFFPDGVALVNKSYEEEVGRLDARERLRTPEVRAQLATFHLTTSEGAPSNLDAWMDAELQASTRRLGALIAQRGRITLDPDAPSAQELLNAKRALIALVTQIFTTYRMLDAQLDENARIKVKGAHDAWNAQVHTATARAAARRRADDTGTPSTPPVTPPAT